MNSKISDFSELKRREKTTHLLIAFMASVALHLLIIQGLEIPLTKKAQKADFRKLMKVNLIDQKELPEIRTAGVKNGKKQKSFSLPTQTKTISEKKITKEKAHDILSELTPKKVPQKILKAKNDPKRIEEQGRTAPRKVKRIGMLAKKELQKLTQQASSKIGIESTNLDLVYELPEGIPADQLNEIEQVFYGFQKRTYIKYLNSVIRNFNDYNTRYPQFLKLRKFEKKDMLGKITFDDLGNIKAIKIIKGDNDGKVQKMFESVLNDIQDLPNPPKAFVQDGEFSIYYKLVLGGSN